MILLDLLAALGDLWLALAPYRKKPLNLKGRKPRK